MEIVALIIAILAIGLGAYYLYNELGYSDEEKKEINHINAIAQYWKKECERYKAIVDEFDKTHDKYIKLLVDTLQDKNRHERLVVHMLDKGIDKGIIKLIDEDLKTELLIKHERSEI